MFLLFTSASYAQTQAPDLAVERFRLAVDRGGILDVEWGAISTPRSWSLGAWVGYSENLINVIDATTGERQGSLIGPRVGGNFHFTYGVSERVQFSMVLPVIWFQQRSGTQGVPIVNPVAGVADLRLVPKILLVSQRKRFLSLSILPGITVPSASNETNSENQVTFEPELALSKAWGASRFALNVGYKSRNRRVLQNLVADDELILRAGFAYRLARNRSFPMEVSGSASLFQGVQSGANRGQTGAEVKVGYTVGLTENFQLTAAGGYGLLEGYGTPDKRFLIAVKGGRSGVDQDGDGIWDRFDRCPAYKEDFDNYEDQDGCPEENLVGHDGKEIDKEETPNQTKEWDGTGPRPFNSVSQDDSDGDGFANDVDQCPNEAETVNQYQDYDGCPDEAPTYPTVGETPEEKRRRELQEAYLRQQLLTDKLRAEYEKSRPLDGLLGFKVNDSDGDGVSDRDDYCPQEKGMKQNSGCAQMPAIVIDGTRLINKIEFKKESDEIKPTSYVVVDDLAAFLKQHPAIIANIEGHTDGVGERKMHAYLSLARADAVKAYLIKKGISKKRIETIGKGYSRRIHTDEYSVRGRTANRRAEVYFKRRDK